MNKIFKDSDIAIIGMSCRFPGANDLAAFWKNLCEGVESINFFDNKSTLDSEADPNHVLAGSILENIEYFDAGFFNYSSRDAEIIDPQQRIFLECAWEALEDAGCNPDEYAGLIGVYAGSGFNTYFINNVLPNCGFVQSKNLLGSMLNIKMMLGNDKDYLPTRVSYNLNLRGPSVNIQTACSTSLVAIHFACQSILNGECDLALAGAANIIVPQQAGYFYQEGTVFSPDGHSRTFDAKAQGTLFGSGVAVILLKSLQQAISDNDHIYAVIKGTAINNDGALKVGFTAPSVAGQAAVIEEALAIAEVNSETITYVEAHGTATPLGDPIEVEALTQAFNSEKKGFCGIGSVKTNVGHLGWTAGMAGLIKTVLALQYKKIPPSLHYENPNPQIDFANSPFYVNTELNDWVTHGIPRRAGVSAFGIGGTNAHIVLEEAPERINQKNVAESSYHILTLSAKTQQGLNELASCYSTKIRSMPDDEIANICYTTNTGRKHFKHRLAIVASSGKNIVAKLVDYVETKQELRIKPNSQNKKIIFLFSGQGAEYLGMGRQLYTTHATYRNIIDACNVVLKKIINIDLLDIIFSSNLPDSRINLIEFSKPALYSLQIALAELWKSWGIKPDFVMGENLGEYAAAYIAGVFSLETGLSMILERGNVWDDINFSSPKIGFISSATGLLVNDAIKTSYYWNQPREKSNFKSGIDFVTSLGNEDIFIEIGPGLTSVEIGCQDDSKIILLPSLAENMGDWERMLTSLGILYSKGYPISWKSLHKHHARSRLHLPTYPFQRQRYWIGDIVGESAAD